MNLNRFYKVLVVGGSLLAAGCVSAGGGAAIGQDSAGMEAVDVSANDSGGAGVADAGADVGGGADTAADAATDAVANADAGEPKPCPWAGMDPCTC